MEKQRVFWLVTVLLLAVLNSAQAEGGPSYVLVGGNLVLRPSVSERINNLLWKHNDNLVAEWERDAFDTVYGTFGGRTTLDATTGHLEIKGMTKADAGVYTVKINNKVQGHRYDAIVIREVPQPSVWIRPVACAPTSDNCTLTCAGETTGAEPVTYGWKKDDGRWERSEKDVVITKTETARVKTFSCWMRNPVSLKESEPKPNPFVQEEDDGLPPHEGGPSYILVGGNLVLRPSVSERINNLLWKHNGNLVAEWERDAFYTVYGTFGGRTTLNTTTGHLEIKGMTEADAGVYTVEINNKVQGHNYVAIVIKEVPQPSVWIRPVACAPTLDNCTLTCAGETKGAEPVTYGWKKDDGRWEQSEKDVVITKTETARVKTFSCWMRNPVSLKESEPKPNPFVQEEDDGLPPHKGGPSYFLVGGNLVLRPSVSERINNLLWKHNGNLVAEWERDAFDTVYGTFGGRTTLDTTTGHLEIKGMTEADAGVYTVEINNKVQGHRYVAIVIKEVPH